MAGLLWLVDDCVAVRGLVAVAAWMEPLPWRLLRSLGGMAAWRHGLCVAVAVALALGSIVAV